MAHIRPRRRAGPTLLALVVAGCGMAVPTPPPEASPSPRGALGSPATVPASSPSEAVPSGSSSPGLVPPDAALLARVGEPVVGQLGSYTWRDSGSDSPWLPGTAVTIEPGRSLRFGLSFQVPVDSWSASYATPGEPAPGRPAGLANGNASLEVEAPPPGEWTLALTVQFGQGLGSASWYWRVRVP